MQKRWTRKAGKGALLRKQHKRHHHRRPRQVIRNVWPRSKLTTFLRWQNFGLNFDKPSRPRNICVMIATIAVRLRGASRATANRAMMVTSKKKEKKKRFLLPSHLQISDLVVVAEEVVMTMMTLHLGDMDIFVVILQDPLPMLLMTMVNRKSWKSKFRDEKLTRSWFHHFPE